MMCIYIYHYPGVDRMWSFTKLVLQCSAFGFAENALCFRSFSVASCSLTGHTICETTGCDTTGVHKQCGHSFHKLSDLILPSV